MLNSLPWPSNRIQKIIFSSKYNMSRSICTKYKVSSTFPIISENTFIRSIVYLPRIEAAANLWSVVFYWNSNDCLFHHKISLVSLATLAIGWKQKFVDIGTLFSSAEVKPFILDPIWKIWCIRRKDWTYCVLISSYSLELAALVFFHFY